MKKQIKRKSVSREKFLKEISGCLLLGSAEVEYWRRNVDRYPESVLQIIYAYIVRRNRQLARWIDVGLKNDKDGKYLMELKKILKRTRETIVADQMVSDNKKAEDLISDI